jgi:hypothetical protein
MRYGKLGNPSRLVGGSRDRMARGVEYEGGMLTGMLVDDTAQTVSRKALNSFRCVEMKEFMGSIHVSLAPKVLMFASPWMDFAMRVNVRRASFRGCSERSVSQFTV